MGRPFTKTHAAAAPTKASPTVEHSAAAPAACSPVQLVAGGIFLVMMLRPFLKHISKESRRCAELLAQLPPDMDVEGMVAATWSVVKQVRLLAACCINQERCFCPFLIADRYPCLRW
jgi:hypothetical protein